MNNLESCIIEIKKAIARIEDHYRTEGIIRQAP